MQSTRAAMQYIYVFTWLDVGHSDKKAGEFHGNLMKLSENLEREKKRKNVDKRLFGIIKGCSELSGVGCWDKSEVGHYSGQGRLISHTWSALSMNSARSIGTVI